MGSDGGGMGDDSVSMAIPHCASYLQSENGGGFSRLQ
jgi:hypothetical protein